MEENLIAFLLNGNFFDFRTGGL